MQSGTVSRSAEVVLRGHGQEVRRNACELIGAGCQTLDQIRCADGTACLKVAGLPGCGLQSVQVPEGVVVHVYAAGALQVWHDLCKRAPTHTATGPTTLALSGNACAIRAELRAGYTCESKAVAGWLRRVGLDGPHANYIIGAAVAVVLVVMMMAIKK